MYRSTYTYTRPEGTKQNIPAGHAAMPAMRASMVCAKRAALWGGILAGSICLGIFVALVTGNWIWLAYGAVNLVLGSRFPKYASLVVGAALIYLYGLSLPAVLLVGAPVVCGFLVRASTRRISENMQQVKRHVESSPLT